MILFIIIVYILSVIFSYIYLKIAYSKTGRWSNLKREKSDWLLILIPGLNTTFFLVGLFCFNPKRKIT